MDEKIKETPAVLDVNAIRIKCYEEIGEDLLNQKKNYEILKDRYDAKIDSVRDLIWDLERKIKKLKGE